VTHNEFEVGSTGEPASVRNDTYSGTITSHDFVDFEIRNNLRAAKIVINANGRLETGHQHVPVTRQIHLGEVVINSGGTLEVGFEQDGLHNAGVLNLVNTHGRSGGLTLADGATLLMQINGTTPTLFDSITAQGNVSLDGTLQILVNPIGSPENGQSAASDEYSEICGAFCAPVVGQSFDIITVSGTSPPAGDHNGDGVVDAADYAAWAKDPAGNGGPQGYIDFASTFGDTGGAGPTITGEFDLVTHNLPAGMDFQIDYFPTLVKLTIISAGSGGSVPEPSTFALVGIVLPLLTVRRRQRI
jgi:hypothetical protein